MTYLIKSPVATYCGVSAGVFFDNGVGETDNEHLVTWFKSKGYKVTPKKPQQQSLDLETPKTPTKKLTQRSGKK